MSAEIGRLGIADITRYAGVLSSAAKVGLHCKLESVVDEGRRWRPDDSPVNPSFDELPDLIIDHLTHSPDVHMTSLATDHGIPKRAILAYITAFADQHDSEMLNTIAEFANPWPIVTDIEDESKVQSRQLRVSEQLDIAMKKHAHDVTLAVFQLAVATRVMARGFDSVMSGYYCPTLMRMQNWHYCIAGFKDKNHRDPAGDTYHFWHGALAAISCMQSGNKSLYESATTAAARIAYNSTALATQAARYWAGRQPGETHRAADKAGFRTGKAIVVRFS